MVLKSCIKRRKRDFGLAHTRGTSKWKSRDYARARDHKFL